MRFPIKNVPVGPAGPRTGVKASSALRVFAFKKSWFRAAISSRSRTLSLASSTSFTMAAGPLRPGSNQTAAPEKSGAAVYSITQS